MVKVSLIFVILAICNGAVAAGIPPQVASLDGESSPFPSSSDIYINVLIKGPKGCLQQGRFDFLHVPFFTDDFKITQNFTLAYPKDKVLGHYRTEIEIAQLNKERTRFKLALATYDTDTKPEKLVDSAITFMSGGRFFATISRFDSPDPKLGFAEVAVGDGEFFHAKRKTHPESYEKISTQDKKKS